MRDPIQSFRAAILAALGHAPEVIEPGRFIRFGPHGACWCKLFDDLRGGIFGDWRSGHTQTWTAIDRHLMTRQQRAELARQVEAATRERMAEQRRRWADNGKRIAKVLAQSKRLVPGDAITLYVKHRGLGGVWPLPQCLRHHPALPYWHEGRELGTYAAMIAPLTAPDGRVVALHRTYLTRDGRKAPVPTVKKLTGAAGPLAGASIALYKPERGVLGIAEGIETALAAWCASGVPTVAAYCAGSLATFQWPPSVQRLVIFADHDKAGREAADELRARALRAYLRCDVHVPTTEGADWCDVWAQRGVVAIGGGAA